MRMELAELVSFMRRHRLAIEASVSAQTGPQAAVVGFVVSDAGEVFFDTLSSTRKCQNLRQDPRIALVIGWDDERTVQYEGIADEPRGAELARLKELYFPAFVEYRTPPGVQGELAEPVFELALRLGVVHRSRPSRPGSPFEALRPRTSEGPLLLFLGFSLVFLRYLLPGRMLSSDHAWMHGLLTDYRQALADK